MLSSLKYASEELHNMHETCLNVSIIIIEKKTLKHLLIKFLIIYSIWIELRFISCNDLS